MAVIVRLRRMGGNKKPFFRVVATDSRRPNEGRFLEALGWYDPKKKGTNFELKADRVEYWVSKGARLSDTVRSLMRKLRKAATPAAQA
ncbi:MAG: 30S ribosomal protein S16 [Verrucomicrobia bacterium]|jgi:small subunit ribosomal protein S16|nr:MAG: 30S ribosomal protein S16 [Verrucomicrobiota bacterium]